MMMMVMKKRKKKLKKRNRITAQEEKKNASLPPPDFSEFLMKPEQGFQWQIHGYVWNWKPIDDYKNHPNYRNQKKCAHQHQKKYAFKSGGDTSETVVCKSCLHVVSSILTWMH
jgi:hypothetical protein